MKIPQKSTPVIFYPHADPSEEPVAGIIAKCFEDGVANIAIVHENGDVAPRRAVYPIGSSHIYDEKGNITPGAKRNGAWDFPEWYKKLMSILGDLDSVEIGEDDEVNRSKESTRAKRKYSNEEKEAYVRRLHSEGLTEDEIFGKVRFWGVTRVELNQILTRIGATELVAG